MSRPRRNAATFSATLRPAGWTAIRTPHASVRTSSSRGLRRARTPLFVGLEQWLRILAFNGFGFARAVIGKLPVEPCGDCLEPLFNFVNLIAQPSPSGPFCWPSGLPGRRRGPCRSQSSARRSCRSRTSAPRASVPPQNAPPSAARRRRPRNAPPIAPLETLAANIRPGCGALVGRCCKVGDMADEKVGALLDEPARPPAMLSRAASTLEWASTVATALRE